MWSGSHVSHMSVASKVTYRSHVGSHAGSRVGSHVGSYMFSKYMVTAWSQLFSNYNVTINRCMDRVLNIYFKNQRQNDRCY